MPSAERPRNATRRRPVLSVEGLEARDLLSMLLAHSRQARQPVSTPAVAAMATSAPDLGPPTAHELAKEKFVARMSGSFVTARGRFQNQPVQGEIVATGGSNQSLRLNAQMQFFLFSDPTVPPSGQVAFTPKNVSSTGSLLLLDLTADPTMLSHGLPTHFTWTVDSSSGGLWTNATGQGTLDVTYKLSGKTKPGILSRGSAFIAAQGLIVTNHGLTLDTATAGNRPQNP